MIRLPPRSTRTDTLFPYTPRFRSWVLPDANSADPTARTRTFFRGNWSCESAAIPLRGGKNLEQGRQSMANKAAHPAHRNSGAKKRIRKVFGNIHAVVQMQNLIEVQREAYEQFKR